MFFDDVCGICRESIVTEKKELPCRHSFHNACIESWIMRSNSCPFCRIEACPNMTEHLTDLNEKHWLEISEHHELTEPQMDIYFGTYAKNSERFIDYTIKNLCTYQKLSDGFMHRHWHILVPYFGCIIENQYDNLDEETMNELETYWEDNKVKSRVYWDDASRLDELTEEEMELYLYVYREDNPDTPYQIVNCVIRNFCVFQRLSASFIIRNIGMLYPFFDDHMLMIHRDNLSENFIDELDLLCCTMSRMWNAYARHDF